MTTRSRHPDKRVLFYTHDAFGLGHLSRTLTVVEELARRRKDVAMLVVAGAPKIDGFPLPPNVDIVRIPVAQRRGVYAEAQPITDLYGLTGIFSVRAQIIEAAAHAFRPHVVFVDQSADGLGHELRPLLANLPHTSPSARYIISMDDTGDEIEQMRKELNRGIPGDLLRKRYDRILIRGDRTAIDTAAEYHYPPDIMPKVTYSGFCARPAPRFDRAALRSSLGANERPLIVVATGGGADGLDLVRCYLEMIAEQPLDAASFVVTGPLQDPRSRRDHPVTNDQPGVTTVEFVPDLPRYFAAADLAVTMGGYSTTAELLAAGIRAIIVPRVKPWVEQRMRAERLAAKGLIRMVLPHEATPDRLRSEISAALAEPPPGKRVDCDGARRAAQAIEELLPS